MDFSILARRGNHSARHDVVPRALSVFFVHLPPAPALINGRPRSASYRDLRLHQLVEIPALLVNGKPLFASWWQILLRQSVAPTAPLISGPRMLANEKKMSNR